MEWAILLNLLVLFTGMVWAWISLKVMWNWFLWIMVSLALLLQLSFILYG